MEGQPGKGIQKGMLPGFALTGHNQGAFLPLLPGHIGGKAHRQALPEGVDADTGRQPDLLLPQRNLLLAYVIIPLVIPALGIQHHQKPGADGMVVDTNLNLLRTGGGRPMDIPDQVTGLIGTDAPHQEGVGEQSVFGYQVAQGLGQREGQILPLRNPGVDHHRGG